MRKRLTCRCLSHNGFLTAYGYEVTAQRSLEGFEVVDRGGADCYLDKVGSVSAMRRDETTMIWDEGVLHDQQQRHFASSYRGEG